MQVAGPVSVLATTAVSALFVIVSVTTKYDANGTPHSLLPLPVQIILCLLSPTALSIAIERVSIEFINILPFYIYQFYRVSVFGISIHYKILMLGHRIKPSRYWKN